MFCLLLFFSQGEQQKEIVPQSKTPGLSKLGDDNHPKAHLHRQFHSMPSLRHSSHKLKTGNSKLDKTWLDNFLLSKPEKGENQGHTWDGHATVRSAKSVPYPGDSR